ncbi:MAG: hypothetical protein LC130_28580 [Bryobacterales bacterium]|nr:hypothetical protein [Bryobacterales bacterium]
MSDEQTIREKFDSKTPAEKAQFFRSLRTLLADDEGDPDEAEYIAAHMSDLLGELDSFASYYDEVARQDKRRAEAEDRRRFWDATEGP